MAGTDREPPDGRLRTPAGVTSFPYRSELPEVRALVRAHARAAGLSQGRSDDLVLAVSEVAANTLRHTRASGILTVWHDDREIVCEVRDTGVIDDPLAGRAPPPPGAASGHGLWIVRQVCDLVELNSDSDGTTIRMHMWLRRPPADPSAPH